MREQSIAAMKIIIIWHYWREKHFLINYGPCWISRAELDFRLPKSILRTNLQNDFTHLSCGDIGDSHKTFRFRNDVVVSSPPNWTHPLSCLIKFFQNFFSSSYRPRVCPKLLQRHSSSWRHKAEQRHMWRRDHHV